MRMHNPHTKGFNPGGSLGGDGQPFSERPLQRVGELLATSPRIQNIVLKGFDPVSTGGFTQVPNIVLRSPSLSNNAKVVYAQLLSYAWTNDHCYPGQERMAQDTGNSRTSIYRALQELEEAGWLEVVRRGLGKTNLYVLKYVVDKPNKK